MFVVFCIVELDTPQVLRVILAGLGSCQGNGSVTALSDGLIAQRYLFGATFSGNALINGAIAPDATRDLAGIQSYMAGLTNLTQLLIRFQRFFCIFSTN